MSIHIYLKSYLFPQIEICSLFQAASVDTWERIKFSRSNKRLKIYETTITQNMVYEFKVLQTIYKLKGFRMYESRDEKTNGNDLIFFIQKNSIIYRYAIQAKIIYHKNGKLNDGQYPQFPHKVKGHTREQIDLLLDYSGINNFEPLYLMYNYVSGPVTSWCPKEYYGCTIINARTLKDAFSKKGKLRSNVNFSELHNNPKTGGPAVPWHSIVCPNIIDQVILGNAGISTSPNTSLPDSGFIKSNEWEEIGLGEVNENKRNLDQKEFGFRPAFMFYFNLDVQ